VKNDDLRKILDAVSTGKLTAEAALKKLGGISFEDIEFAKLDHHRALRTGVPEVIFAPGKTDRQIITICEHMQKAGSDILITRVGKSTFVKLKRKFKGIYSYR